MVIVPDAPWWANIALLLFIASVPIILALKAARDSRAVAVETRDVAATVASQAAEVSGRTSSQLDRVLHNVENSHRIGLRDDLDRQVQRLAESIDTVGVQVAVLHDDVSNVGVELRHARTSISDVHQELRDVRADARVITARVGALERENVVTQTVDGVQSLFSDEDEQGSVES